MRSTTAPFRVSESRWRSCRACRIINAVRHTMEGIDVSRHIKVLTGLSLLALVLVAATVLVDVRVDDREPATVLCARWTYAGIALPLTVLGAFISASRPGKCDGASDDGGRSGGGG